MFGKAKPNYKFYSITFLVGTIAGAAVALLYAPTTGRKLQKQLKGVIDDSVENVQSAVRRVVNA